MIPLWWRWWRAWRRLHRAVNQLKRREVQIGPYKAKADSCFLPELGPNHWLEVKHLDGKHLRKSEAGYVILRGLMREAELRKEIELADAIAEDQLRMQEGVEAAERILHGEP